MTPIEYETHHDHSRHSGGLTNLSPDSCSRPADTIALAGFDPWYGLRYSWSKAVNFAGCIFGVGVPIGLVWAFATSPALWRYVLNLGPMPASYGSSAYNYMSWVKNRCVYAIR